MWTKEKARDWSKIINLPFEDTQSFFEIYDAPENSEIRLQFSTVFDMMHTYGQILKNGLFDPVWMYDSMVGWSVIGMWNKYDPIIKEIRKRRNAPLAYEYFEYLAEEMEKVERIKL